MPGKKRDNYWMRPMEVDDIPVLELKVKAVKGKTIGLFAGRAEDELRWIAWRLHEGIWGRADPSE